MNKKQALAIGGAAAVSLLIGVPVFAAATTTPTGSHPTHMTGKGHGTHGPKLTNAAFGRVASINGSTFTITRRAFNGSSTPATATTATITTTDATTYKKNGQADTASDLAVGQRVVVMGTKDSEGNIASATSVNIMERPAGAIFGGKGKGRRGKESTSTPTQS